MAIISNKLTDEQKKILAEKVAQVVKTDAARHLILEIAVVMDKHQASPMLCFAVFTLIGEQSLREIQKLIQERESSDGILTGQ